MADPSAPAAARVAAATAVLDRGWGRPVQAVDATIADTIERPDESPIEAARKIAFALALAKRELDRQDSQTQTDEE